VPFAVKKMIATIENFKVDLSKPIDISITNTDANPIAWYMKTSD
jgi:hypothetical protein